MTFKQAQGIIKKSKIMRGILFPTAIEKEALDVLCKYNPVKFKEAKLTQHERDIIREIIADFTKSGKTITI